MSIFGMDGYFMKKFISVIERRMPNRTKRLVFISSLAMRLSVNNEVIDEAMLIRLNKELGLANNASSMQLPAYMSDIIWSSMKSHELITSSITKEKLTNARIKRIIKSVLLATPCWLKYDDEKHIAQDVEKLISSRSIVFGV